MITDEWVYAFSFGAIGTISFYSYLFYIIRDFYLIKKIGTSTLGRVVGIAKDYESKQLIVEYRDDDGNINTIMSKAWNPFWKRLINQEVRIYYLRSNNKKVYIEKDFYFLETLVAAIGTLFGAVTIIVAFL